MGSPGDDGDGTDGSTGSVTDSTREGDRGVPARTEWRSAGGDDRPPRSGQRASEEESELQLFVYDLVSSVVAVLIVGAYLFAISGVWPPLVAVESGSMIPNMQVNDLVFVMEEERFPGENAHGDTGVVTAQAAAENNYRKFGNRGDVIVFAPDGNAGQTPIIHRAMFYVEEGENWYDRADEDYIGGADACEPADTSRKEDLRNCPAPHSGFITKGDNNAVYDQAGGGANTGPVKPEWVVGTAEVRIPWLGWVRLSTQ